MNKFRNSAVIFINKKRTPGQADYQGSITLNGVMYDIYLWKKISKMGEPYMAGTINNIKPKNKGELPEYKQRMDYIEPPGDDPF